MIRRVKSARPASFNPQTNTVKLEQLTFSDGFLNVETGKTPKSFPPVVTATAWGIHDLRTGELLFEKRADEQREMASLTKIMTCYLTYQLLKRFNQNPEQLTFQVNQVAARIFGTHAGLRENDTVKVIDLLYGLMLPSGNDCALVLAYGFGSMLINSKRSRVVDRLPRSLVQEFVKEMNKLAMKLGLRATCFTNPHGLSEKANKSTASDLGKLAFHAMDVPLIQKIVSTQNYNTEVMDARGQTRVVCWRNTNKLLEKGFLGLKTGTTPSAGLCLSSVLKNGDEGVIVTLLNAKTDKHRWMESEKLAHWAIGMISGPVRTKSRGFLFDGTRPKFVVRMIPDMVSSRFL